MLNRIQLSFVLLLLGGIPGGAGCRPGTTTDLSGVNTGHNAGIALSRFEIVNGGIIRGDKNRKALALSFTGHEFAEGADTILDELQKHHAKGSFFFTGDFVANPAFRSLIQRLVAAGHYFSIHSDKHLLYCSWGKERTTLVTREQMQADLEANAQCYQRLNLPQPPGRFFIPPFENYNQQIVAWADKINFTLINFTPGTRSNADYTGEADQNFVSSQAIFDSIVKREREDPHGLNGFILLLHIGSGPGRTDKFSARFGELLDYLGGKGYEFVRVDELLEPKKLP